MAVIHEYYSSQKQSTLPFVLELRAVPQIKPGPTASAQIGEVVRSQLEQLIFLSRIFCVLVSTELDFGVRMTVSGNMTLDDAIKQWEVNAGRRLPEVLSVSADDQ